MAGWLYRNLNKKVDINKACGELVESIRSRCRMHGIRIPRMVLRRLLHRSKS